MAAKKKTKKRTTKRKAAKKKVTKKKTVTAANLAGESPCRERGPEILNDPTIFGNGAQQRRIEPNIWLPQAPNLALKLVDSQHFIICFQITNGKCHS